VKVNYTLLSGLCMLASVPMVVLLLNRRMAGSAPQVVRIATFDAGLVRAQAGELLRELRGGGSEAGKRIAAAVQRADVDVLFLCGLDRDAAGETARVFAREYLAVAQGRLRPIDFEFVFAPPVNAGEASGQDLDGDGRSDGPGDAYAPGAFAGSDGLALLSRHPLDTDGARTFRMLPWSAMPDALRPPDVPDAAWPQLRLSSRNHCDVTMHVLGADVHLLCSHPTRIAVPGAGEREARRNHDEISFWCDYLTPARAGWIVDDRGAAGGLPAAAHFVVLGDLECDPVDGPGRRDAIAALLAHERVLDPKPGSAGAAEESKRQWGANATHKGEPGLCTADLDDDPSTGPGNLRLDYVLVARSLRVVDANVVWPRALPGAAAAADAPPHHIVWADFTLQPSK